MAKVTINEKRLYDWIDSAVYAWAKLLLDKILLITPRDYNRPPKNIDRKDWKPSRRKWATSKNWHRYEWVTGHLQKSLGIQKISNWKYLVWIRGWMYNTEIYWAAQEFGTVKIPPRSYLRKGLEDNMRLVQKAINSVFNQYLK